MHGLRAAVAAEIVPIGAGVEGAKAVGAWKSDKLARKYAAGHDQRRMNAQVVDQWNAEFARKNAARAQVRESRRGGTKLRVVEGGCKPSVKHVPNRSGKKVGSNSGKWRKRLGSD